jgi:hypothetical protein
MIQWEYKVVFRSHLSEAALNALGVCGWELISVMYHSSSTSYDYNNYYFKRQQTENE